MPSVPASVEPKALSIVVGSDGIAKVTTSKEEDTVLKVSSSDDKVATGSFEGKTVTIHGVKDGKATITVGLSDGKSVEVAATVTAV